MDREGGRGSNKDRKLGEGWTGREAEGAIRTGRWQRDDYGVKMYLMQTEKVCDTVG